MGKVLWLITLWVYTSLTSLSFTGVWIQVQNYCEKRLLLNFFWQTYNLGVSKISSESLFSWVLSRFPTNLEHYPRKCRNLHNHTVTVELVAEFLWCGVALLGVWFCWFLFLAFGLNFFCLVAILPLWLCIKRLLYRFSWFLCPLLLLMFLGFFNSDWSFAILLEISVIYEHYEQESVILTVKRVLHNEL